MQKLAEAIDKQNDFIKKSAVREKTAGEIELSQIKQKKSANPRKTFNKQSIVELANSIDRNGLLQPILLDTDRNLIAGARRVAAFKHLKKEKIPYIVFDKETKDPGFLSVIENIQREEVPKLELAEYCYQLRKKHKLKTQEIADILGKSKGWISQLIGFFEENKNGKEVSLSEYKNTNPNGVQFNFRWKLSKKVEKTLTKTKEGRAKLKSIQAKVKQMEKLRSELENLLEI